MTQKGHVPVRERWNGDVTGLLRLTDAIYLVPLLQHGAIALAMRIKGTMSETGHV